MRGGGRGEGRGEGLDSAIVIILAIILLEIRSLRYCTSLPRSSHKNVLTRFSSARRIRIFVCGGCLYQVLCLCLCNRYFQEGYQTYVRLYHIQHKPLRSSRRGHGLGSTPMTSLAVHTPSSSGGEHTWHAGVRPCPRPRSRRKRSRAKEQVEHPLVAQQHFSRLAAPTPSPTR